MLQGVWCVDDEGALMRSLDLDARISNITYQVVEISLYDMPLQFVLLDL